MAAQQPDEARQLFERALRYRGGERLRAVYAYRERYTRHWRGPKGESADQQVDTFVALPDRVHAEYTAGGYKEIVVVTPSSAFRITNGQTVQLPAYWATNWRLGLQRNVFTMARLWRSGGLAVSVAGTETVDGVAARILEVRVGADTSRAWIDPASGRTLRLQTSGLAADGSSLSATAAFSDFRLVDGITTSFRQDFSSSDGSSAINQGVGFQVNPEVDPRLFYDKPMTLDQLAFNPSPALPAPLVMTGRLRLDSTPAGAQLYVDDVYKGVTSIGEGRLIVEDVSPGDHRVRVAAAGFKEWNRTARLEPGDDVVREAVLERAGPPPLTIDDLEKMLRASVAPKRAAVLVQERGVDFVLDDEKERRLRAAGADTELLLSVAKAKR